MTDDNMQMDEHDYLKATFFSTEAEVAAAHAEAEQRRAARRERRLKREDITALRLFVKHIERCPVAWREAAIRYLIDRYLYWPRVSAPKVDAVDPSAGIQESRPRA